ncbi:MAG: ATP12 family protein [Hyphomicrobiaceae bacterium]
MTEGEASGGAKSAAFARAELPRRFYGEAKVGPGAADGTFRVLLDGRPLRTPGKRSLEVPRAGLAEAIAEEWRAQGERIDPASMPLTRLVNSALDGVAGREGEVAADIARYAGSDLLCYRAGHPDSLVRLQRQHWDPPLAWARSVLGCDLKVGEGVVHVAQPADTGARFAAAIAGLDHLALAALHTLTTLAGSAVLALAIGRGALGAEAAWSAAHVDEDWQISQWGTDAEAMRRRADRKRDFDAAALLLALTDPFGPNAGYV